MGETRRLYAAVEAGGTKFNCALGFGPDAVVARTRIATRDPASTLAEVAAFFDAATAAHGPAAALGIASFGPLDLDAASPTWGHIAATTKPGWDWADVAGPLGRRLACPVGFDTDVHGAALGEHRWGAGQGLPSLVYV